MVRTFIAAILLVALIPAVVAANATTWASRTILDEAVFTTTVENTLNETDLQRGIANSSARALVEMISGSPILYGALATQVLGLDASASNDTVRSVLTDRILALLDRPSVKAERDRAVLAVHAVLTDGLDVATPPIIIRGSQVSLDLAPIIQRVVDELDPRLTQAGLPPVPSGFAVLDVAPARTITDFSSVAGELDRDRGIAPLIATLLAVAILLVAHRRMRAIGLIGGVCLLAGLVSVAAANVAIAQSGAATISADAPIADHVVAEATGSFGKVLMDQSFALIVGGGAVAFTIGVVLVATRRD